MERDSNQTDYLEQLIEQLDDESMSLIDFDELKLRLSELREKLTGHGEMADELTALRQDYHQRIAGMVKAIAAVNRKRDCWQEAVAFVEGLPSLTAEELLEQYRRICARFRDCFPAARQLTYVAGRSRRHGLSAKATT